MKSVAGAALTERIYERLCLASAIVIALVVVPANVLQRMPWQVDVVSAAFGLVSWQMYRLARRGRIYPAAFLAGMVTTITLAWFPNAGSIGSIPFFFLPAVAYAVIFFRGRARIAIASAIVVDPLALMLLEVARPDWLTPFVSAAAMRVDLAVGLTMTALLTALMLWVVTGAYDAEQRSREATVLALHEAREEFARLFQMNPDAVYLVDPGVPAYVDVNHGFERLTGWNKPEVIGRSAGDLKLWVDHDERQKLYENLARVGHLQNFISRFRRRDGVVFWGSTSVSWVEMSGRRLLLFTTRDETTRIEAQRRDAESRALLSALIDSTDDDVWQVEPERFAFTAFNAAYARRFQEMFGEGLLVGRSLHDLVSRELADAWAARYRRAIEEGPYSMEYADDLSGRTLLISLSPVTHESDVFGVSVFSRDITDLKRAADARARTSQQLLQSQKMESLGSLAGGVAHDFNNMLTAIMGNADLLLNDEWQEDRQTKLQAIMQAAARSRDLTGKLLAFGRRGKNIVQSVDLTTIVRDSLDILRPTISASVVVDVDMRARWSIDGDPSQMSQVLINLCVNANEAMPAGGAMTIASRDVVLAGTAAAVVALAEGEFVKLTVADSGVGMDEDVRARIFEPFFTTKVGGQVQGTGLGLSTVYGIIQSHGGNIVVESQAGVGTSFTIYLPKGTLVPETPSVPAPVAAGAGVILVAEDEPMVRQLLIVAIEGLGYRVIAAEDGEAAVRAFTEHSSEITGVLLDLKMPRKGGREAFLEMRAIDPTVPVLICSGYGDNEEAQSMISLGAKGLLAKPFGMSDLSAHLVTLAGRRG